MKKFLLISLLLLWFLCTQAQCYLCNYIPTDTSNSSLINYNDFIVKFNNKYCLPSCSFFLLTKAHAFGTHITRVNNFHADPNFACTQPEYYSHSGYDKGHMTAFEDMSYSLASAYCCFVMTNMIPQLPAFNRKTWYYLERTVRYAFIKNHDSLIVYTGAILDTVTTKGSINVPAKCYKVVYCPKDNEYIAFIAHNLPYGSAYNYYNWVVTLQSLEAQTGLTFPFKSAIYDAKYWLH